MEWILGLAAILVGVAVASFAINAVRRPEPKHDAVSAEAWREAERMRAMSAATRRGDRR